MKKFIFTGQSDDTVIEEVTGLDHDDYASNSIRVFEVSDEKNKIWVTAQYSPENTPGCWAIGIQTDDNNPVPDDWKLYFVQGEIPYSPSLCVEIPSNNAKVKLLNRDC